MAIPRLAAYPMPSVEQFPENRVMWQAEPHRAALLVHDMQDYFLDFYDTQAAPIPQLMSNIRHLIDACDAAGIPVYYTAQPAIQPEADRALLNEFWGPGLPARPERVGIAAALSPRPEHHVLDKWRYSAFIRSDFEQQLKASGRDQLIVCGIYAHIGCQTTCVDAFMRDIQPIMVGDALADFSPEWHQQALQYVAQRAGVVSSTRQVLSALGAGLPQSLEMLHQTISQLLAVPVSDFTPEDNLLDMGLDSIRLMSLVERWKRSGAELSFVQLAEEPTLNHWWQLLQGAR